MIPLMKQAFIPTVTLQEIVNMLFSLKIHRYLKSSDIGSNSKNDLPPLYANNLYLACEKYVKAGAVIGVK